MFIYVASGSIQYLKFAGMRVLISCYLLASVDWRPLSVPCELSNMESWKVKKGEIFLARQNL
jgi:hypothetical protein